ncbi:hypothetical protein [Cupriavidus basilensis]|uniref:hypothetical protein n=1 Tax=Cupriavidus basilensis TaxID=68895 RepID=UPI0039F72A99
MASGSLALMRKVSLLLPWLWRAAWETALATAALVALLFAALCFIVTTVNLSLLTLQLVSCLTIAMLIIGVWTIASFNQLSDRRG